MSNGVYYLVFPSGNPFGYYAFLSDSNYLYHFDLGYEYVFDAADGKSGVYFYDFKSGDFFYTSPTFPFPYLYDFSLNSVLYYFPDPHNAGRYKHKRGALLLRLRHRPDYLEIERISVGSAFSQPARAPIPLGPDQDEEFLLALQQRLRVGQQVVLDERIPGVMLLQPMGSGS